MSDEKKEGWRTWLLHGVIVLAGICVGSGLGVGVLYALMRNDIAAQQQGVFRSRLALVLGKADRYDEVGAYEPATPEDARVYENKTEGGTLYAATGTAQGYQSQVTVLVSVRAEPDGSVGADPQIEAAAVVSSQETPGLGENVNLTRKDTTIWQAVLGKGKGGAAARPDFQVQFSGLRRSDVDVVMPANEKLDAITGATITSNAVRRAVLAAIDTIVARTSEVHGK